MYYKLYNKRIQQQPLVLNRGGILAVAVLLADVLLSFSPYFEIHVHTGVLCDPKSTLNPFITS